MCLSVKQRFGYIIYWKLLDALLSDKYSAYSNLGDYEVDEELFSIHGFGEKMRRREVLLELL